MGAGFNVLVASLEFFQCSAEPRIAVTVESGEPEEPESGPVSEGMVAAALT